MIELNILNLSAIFILCGLIGYVFISKLIKVTAHSTYKDINKSTKKTPIFLPENSEAYILVETGGKITYSNQAIKELFNLNGEKPTLEIIAADLQPTESLFALCAREGRARLNLGHQLIEGRSYQVPYNSHHAMLVSFRELSYESLISGKTESTAPLELRPRVDERSSIPKSAGLVGDFFASTDFPMRAIHLTDDVLERTRQLELEHQRTETLLRITKELSSSLDFERILQRTLEVLNEVIGASHATCMVLQPGTKNLRHLATVGYANPLPPGGMPSALNINQGLVGWIISNRQPVLINDVLEDRRWIQLPNSWYHHRSAIGVPIIIGDQLLGVLLLYYPEVGKFSAQQLDLIQAAANQMAVAIKNAELYHLTLNQKEELSKLLSYQKIETSRSRSILEAIADGVLVTDQNGEITLFNHSAESMLGLKRAEVVGKPINHFTELINGITMAWVDTINAWMENPDQINPMNTFSEQVGLENGSVLSVNLAPVMNNNKFYGTVSVFRDITHLIEVDRLKSEFVATVSHELRTPMTSIKGYVDILLMGVAGDLSQQQLRFLRVVQQNTERLTILVNDLLDLSRIESGQVELSFEPLDLHHLVDEIMLDVNRLSIVENKNMHFNIDLPSEIPHILGDLERIRQIFINLLGNAFQYTPPNGKVNIRARKIGDEVQIDIKDNGIGIPPKDQERIFDRFYRGENNMVITTAGTGLGLSIVAKLINMHHGRIWVSSSGIEGEGSTFSFTLPISNKFQNLGRVKKEHVKDTRR